MSPKNYLNIDLKKTSRVTYANDSERREPVGLTLPTFSSNKIIKSFKYNFIEILGKGINLSPVLNKTSIFKNKDKNQNPFVKTEEKLDIKKNKTKKGTIIDNWEIVFWNINDFKKYNNSETGEFELKYFNELTYGDIWEYNIFSHLSFEIFLNSKKFNLIKKAIIGERRLGKDEEVNNYKFPNDKLMFKKFRVEFDPDNRGPITMGYNVDTGKRIPKNKETIIGYIFSIDNFELI
jgi:hypothetical protein|tara:strand:+ start:91 stop:795 length:705 start_codon:yes stop_codon:yes gene_type:complete